MATEKIRAEITGTVWKIVTRPGQQLAEEEPILIMESMKMQIPVMAPDTSFRSTSALPWLPLM